jgi:pimeloyl-ACP methyl ester carboxylesterase
MAFHSNRDLSGDLSGTTLAIVVQHGHNRNGTGYLATVAGLVSELGQSADNVLVIAPQFFIRGEGHRDVPAWTAAGWMAGADASGTAISSFDVYDHLLEWLAERRRFPKLKHIVLAGHSAGAQLVQRYAALNAAEEKLRDQGITVRYVVANPSSYLYFTNERPGPSGFAPYGFKVCGSYDDYKYGFLNPVRYAAQVDPGAAFERYGLRDVVYLLGASDTDPVHPQLDRTCAAMAQGKQRLERGLNYAAYLRYLGGMRGNIVPRAYEVDGVGHNQRRMFRSACGAHALFDVAATPHAAATCRELR